MMWNPCEFIRSGYYTYTCWFLFHAKGKETFFHRVHRRTSFKTGTGLGLRWCKHRSISVAMTHCGFSGKGTAARRYNKGGHTDSGGQSILHAPRQTDGRRDEGTDRRGQAQWTYRNTSSYTCGKLPSYTAPTLKASPQVDVRKALKYMNPSSHITRLFALRGQRPSVQALQRERELNLTFVLGFPNTTSMAENKEVRGKTFFGAPERKKRARSLW